MEPTLSTEDRELKALYELNVQFYRETKTLLGDRSQRTRFNLGFSADKVIRVCPTDFTIDFEKAIDRVFLKASALQRIYIKGSVLGKANEDTWLFLATTPEEFAAIELSAQTLVLAELTLSGLHPLVTYLQPVDLR